MEPGKPWDQLSVEELKELFKDQQELHEEIEEEMEFVLKNSACHLPGNTRAKYEQQLALVAERISRIERLLNIK